MTEIFYDRIIKPIRLFISTHPYLCCIILTLFYLLFFQNKYLLSGDVWAEGYIEYLTDARTKPWLEIFTIGWAGYLTVLPSLLSHIYVKLHFLVGYIDLYYRFIDIVFAVACTTVFSAKFFRSVIRSDAIRIFASIVMLMLLSDVSSFSFINIWYVGFVPLVLISLSERKISNRKQLVYSTFGVLIALTKPSVVLLPFLIMRIVRTKEYLSNGIIILSILLQITLVYHYQPKTGLAGSKLLLFSKSILGTLVGLGTAFNKFLQIKPQSIIFVALGLLLVTVLYYYLFKMKGWMVAVAFSTALLFSVYSYVLAPDYTLYQGWRSYPAIYNSNYKSQREFLINLFILLPIILLIPYLKTKHTHKLASPKSIYFKLAACIALVMLLYRQIDVSSSAVASDISLYRNSLNSGETICVPIPPNPTYLFGVKWLYQHRGGCIVENTEKKLNFKAFNQHIIVPAKIELYSPKKTLKSLQIPIYYAGKKPANIYLKDLSNNKIYMTTAKLKSPDNLYFINYNLAGLANRESYIFEIFSDNPGVMVGQFEFEEVVAVYPYFMGHPNLQEH